MAFDDNEEAIIHHSSPSASHPSSTGIALPFAIK